MADSSTSSTSSTSQNASKPRKRSQFRAKIKVQKIEIVVRNLHQNNIKLYVKNLKRKRSKYTQHKMAARNQTKDLKCATHLLSDKFRNMAEEKKAIVRDLGFGGLMHVPPLRVDHQLLRELANNFKLGENKLKTGYGSFQITPKTIGDALGINATGNLFPEKVEYKQLYKQLSDDDKIIYRRFQDGVPFANDDKQNIARAPRPNFKMDGISERNWGAHVLTFLIKGITDYQDKKKKAIDGCLFALMIIYFHLSENKGKKRAERPPKPWIANWTKEKLVERMTAEKEETLGIVKMAETRAREKMKEKEKKEKTQEIKKTKKRKASPTSSSETETATDSDTTTSESESQQDSEDSARKHPIKRGKKWTPEKESRGKRSQILIQNLNLNKVMRVKNHHLQRRRRKRKNKNNTKKTQPKKKKVLVEDSPPKEDQYFDGETYEISSDELDEWLGQNVDKSAAEGENQPDLRSTEGRYVSSETIPAVNLGTDAPSSQGNTEQSSVNQPSQSMLSPSDSNMMVVREQTPSEALAIVPIQVFVPASQTTTETDFEPTPMLQIEGTTETTPETPKQLQETTPTVPPAPTKVRRRRCCPVDDGTDSFLCSKTDPGVPSFSLGLTDSSQEGASTQETEMEKSPEAANLIEQLDSLVQRIASSATKGKNTSPQIQRETGGESSAKFETPRGLYQITDDMKQKCYIWGTRLKEDADGNTNEYEEMCTLIGQGEYILMRMHLASLQAKCMALSDHPNGEFVSPKTKKEFRVEAYPSFIPFIDRKKLTSHPYIFAPVCYAGHWWLWLINTRKRKCQILDPLHKIAPTDERKTINKFTGYVFSRLITYAGGKPLQKGEREKEIKSPYVKISGQKQGINFYDCAVYVMKWMEIIEPENIKKGKYQWDNWPQEEVDHYRVEYASRILFSEMNTQRDQAIRESSAIRLSKPSSILLSPFCQINSTDIESG
ncbi:uncharacterized protein DS421_13g425510 [Arachis hypogaea]|nr:uncharacterized protein DS421_13g425510 [Arachis hypogaea]